MEQTIQQSNGVAANQSTIYIILRSWEQQMDMYVDQEFKTEVQEVDDGHD